MQRKGFGKKYLALGLAAVLGTGGVLPAAAAENRMEPDLSAGSEVRMLAHYPLQEDAADSSGNGEDGQVHGSVTWTDGLVLPGGKKTSAGDASYVTLPEGMFDGKDEVTVSVWIKSNTDKGNYSALFFGTQPQSNSMPLNYWLFNPTNPAGLFKSVFTNSDSSGAPYNTEVGVTSGSTVEYKGVWTHYTTVLTDDSVTGYVNGEKAGSSEKTKKVSDFGTGLQAYIGRSNYVNDNTYAGAFQDLRIYDGAMSDTEAEELYLDTSDVNDNVKAKVLKSIADQLSLDDLLDYGMVGKEGNLGLPEAFHGASITWTSDQKGIISDAGAVTLPDIMTQVTLTAELKLGESVEKKEFPVTVMAKEGQLAYWKDQLKIPYVLDKNAVLPVSLGKVTVSWTQEASIGEDGSVDPDFLGKKQVTLKAVLKEGNQEAVKEFPVWLMGKDAVYAETYTRTPDGDYSVNLAYSMHLAYSEDGENGYTALNDNSGILYMRAAGNANETLTRKGMKNPYLFYRQDGGFGAAATRVEVGGETDGQKDSSVMLYTSEDLLSYEEVGFVDLKTDKTVNNPVCEYDSSDGIYRITWNDGQGNYYQNTLDSLNADTKVSDPETASAPAVSRAETGISGAAEGNRIPLEHRIGTRLKTKLSKLVNTGVEVPEKVTAASKEEVENIRAAACYNDGSTASKKVEWDLGSVDFETPGTYTVNGTVTQLTFNNENYLFYKRPDPEMVNFKDKFYFISTDEDGQSRIFIRESDTLGDIGSSAESLLLSGSSYPDMFTNCLWAPELHVIGGDLYLFFSGSASNWSGVQSYVMKLKEDADPSRADSWQRPVRVKDKNGANLYEPSVGITLDMTYFEVAGQSYVVWAQRRFSPNDLGSWLYIATVNPEEPWKLTSDSVCISKPDYGWDNNNTFVDEGPFLIQRDGNLYLTFSGAGVDPTYCVGILTAQEGDDLLDTACWKKGNYPILTSRSVPGQYGPGHNSYVYDEDGTLYNVYHAQWNKGARSASIRRVHFDIDGMPVLDLVEERDLLDKYRNVSMQVEVPAPAKEVTLTYTAGEGGRIEGTAVQTMASGSDAQTVTAAAKEGYRFVRWSDGKTEASRTDRKVMESRTYTALFEKKTVLPEMVTVAYTAGEGGRIEGNALQTIEKGGTAAAVKAAANPGYTFVRWSDGKTEASRSDRYITASIKVTAEFKKAETPQAPKVILSAKSIVMGQKEKVTLKASVVPAGASQKITWKSNKSSVVRVSKKGKLTAKKTGSATITAAAANGAKATCKVLVKKAPGELRLSAKTKTLKKGRTYQIKSKLISSTASYKLTYQSGKKAVAAVSAKGKVTAKKKGTAVITVKTYNNKKATIRIKVR